VGQARPAEALPPEGLLGYRTPALAHGRPQPGGAEALRVPAAGLGACAARAPKAAKAQAYFEHALSVARVQHAKSWELRAAMSMARLWRDQGKPQQARELLAPV
jgi:hypothetical protein